ncbi:MAG: prolyl oligopeptidase family serine peptidase [Gemmatimonadota bacterium]
MRTARLLFAALLLFAAPAAAQSSYMLQEAPFSVADVLSPGFPFDLVAAPEAERIAWLEYERGMRNVWTAAAPDFEPVRLTDWTADDGHDLSGLQISDDGATVAFIRGHAPNRDGWVANPTSDPAGAERAVWAMRTSGGAPWRVLEANGFTLSPDGRHVLVERGGQIHRAPVDPNALDAEAAAAEPYFTVYGNNGDPAWSPDGTRVLFETGRGDHSYVAVYDTRDPGITYLAPGVDRDVNPVWSPDGSRVAFLRRPGQPFGASAERDRSLPASAYPDGLLSASFRGGHTLEIWVADPSTGEGRRLWASQPGDDPFDNISSFRWVGEHLVFELEPDNWRHWYSISVRDPQPTPVHLTPGEGFVEQVDFSEDGRWLYYAANMGDIDRRDLWRVPVAGGTPENLTNGAGIETWPAVLPSGETVAVLYADARQPQTVAVLPADGGQARTIRALPAEFPYDQHVVPENVIITAEDGLETNNQLFLPPDLQPGERRPAVIFIHGGSRRQMLLGYHYRHFYHMAYAYNQYLANRGYVVLSVNYRSGIGYGREFRNAPDVGRRGNAEYGDIIAAGRYLQGRADVDPERVGLWGLSYGGVLTAQGLARNSDVFKSGVDLAGVHLWGSTVDPADVSYQSSAIAAIDSWTSPVMLLHGDDDRNVAFSQTVGLVQLLRAHDVPYELIVFPDDVHDSLLFHRWVLTFDAADDFLERTLVRGEGVRVAW